MVVFGLWPAKRGFVQHQATTGLARRSALEKKQRPGLFQRPVEMGADDWRWESCRDPGRRVDSLDPSNGGLAGEWEAGGRLRLSRCGSGLGAVCRLYASRGGQADGEKSTGYPVPALE